MLGAGVEVAVRRGRLIAAYPQPDTGAVPWPSAASRRHRTTRTSSGSTSPATGWPRPKSCSAATPSGVTTGIHLDGVLLSAEKRSRGEVGMTRQRAVADERHGARRSDQLPTGVQSGGRRGAPAPDRGGQRLGQRRRRSSWREQALDAAQRADRAVGRGGDLPRLHGVPFTVKENIDVAGTPTTQGLKALADAYPGRDAPIVERMRAAGGIADRPDEPPQRRGPLALRERALGRDRKPLGPCLGPPAPRAPARRRRSRRA